MSAKSLNNLSPSVFNTELSFSSDQHSYENSSSTQGKLIKLFYKTNRYEKYSKIVTVIELCNKILKNTLLKDLSPNKIKAVVNNFYILRGKIYRTLPKIFQSNYFNY